MSQRYLFSYHGYNSNIFSNLIPFYPKYLYKTYIWYSKNVLKITKTSRNPAKKTPPVTGEFGPLDHNKTSSPYRG